MNSSRSSSSPRLSIKHLLMAAVLFSGLGLSVMADSAKSLLPAFGTDGTEFTSKAKNDNLLHGWLPKEWLDNSEWGPVSATYTKLTDSPDKDAGAVRIKIEKIEEGGQLQFTTFGGNQKYKQGTKYTVTGWVRSADHTVLKVGARALKEPYDFYYEDELAGGADWKRFEFAFTPTMDIEAFIMFFARDPGTVDLAGVTVEAKP